MTLDWVDIFNTDFYNDFAAYFRGGRGRWWWWWWDDGDGEDGEDDDGEEDCSSVVEEEEPKCRGHRCSYPAPLHTHTAAFITNEITPPPYEDIKDFTN